MERVEDGQFARRDQGEAIEGASAPCLGLCRGDRGRGKGSSPVKGRRGRRSNRGEALETMMGGHESFVGLQKRLADAGKRRISSNDEDDCKMAGDAHIHPSVNSSRSFSVFPSVLVFHPQLPEIAHQRVFFTPDFSTQLDFCFFPNLPRLEFVGNRPDFRNNRLSESPTAPIIPTGIANTHQTLFCSQFYTHVADFPAFRNIRRWVVVYRETAPMPFSYRQFTAMGHRCSVPGCSQTKSTDRRFPSSFLLPSPILPR